MDPTLPEFLLTVFARILPNLRLSFFFFFGGGGGGAQATLPLPSFSCLTLWQIQESSSVHCGSTDHQTSLGAPWPGSRVSWGRRESRDCGGTAPASGCVSQTGTREDCGSMGNERNVFNMSTTFTSNLFIHVRYQNPWPLERDRTGHWD